jgi:hypothetical protein
VIEQKLDGPIPTLSSKFLRLVLDRLLAQFAVRQTSSNFMLTKKVEEPIKSASLATRKVAWKDGTLKANLTNGLLDTANTASPKNIWLTCMKSSKENVPYAAQSHPRQKGFCMWITAIKQAQCVVFCATAVMLELGRFVTTPKSSLTHSNI